MPTTPPLRVAAIVQARMGSSRLPGKVLAQIGDRSALHHLLARIVPCRTVDVVVIATSTAAADDALTPALQAEIAAGEVSVFRGDEADVLARFAGAAEASHADVIVRLTGDCPLLDGDEVDRVVGAFLDRRAQGEPLDFLRNQRGEVRRIPHGLDVEVMTSEALLRAHREATAPGEREHVTPWLYAADSPLHIDHSDPPGRDRSHLRLTVDTAEDLAVLRAVIEALGPDATATEACDWLDQHAEVRALQDGLRQQGILSSTEARRVRVAGRHLLARVDAGAGIGYGHMARVEAIVGAWVAAGGTANLLGWGLGGPVATRLAAIGVGTTALAAPAAVAGGAGPDDVADADGADALRTIAAAETSGAVAVLVDGYPFRAPWQRAVAAARPLIAIDDLASFAQVANIVVNQNVGFDPGRYTIATDTRCRLLVGAPFVLLRDELREALPDDDTTTARRVLVAFGGADLGGWTLPVTDALRRTLPPDVTIDVLLGPGAADTTCAALADRARRDDRVTLRRNLSAVAPWMDGALLAVCAAGSTCWELLARGVVPVAVPLAENQRAVSAGLVSHGAGVVVGWHIDADALADATAALLDDVERLAALRQAGRRLIDGRGVWRVMDAALDAIDMRTAS